MSIVIDDPEECIALAKKSLPLDRFKQVCNALNKFRQNPHYPSLRYRKLANSENKWIIDANKGDRIILLQITQEFYEIIDIGTHDLYRRQNR